MQGQAAPPTSDLLLAKLETDGVVGSPAAVIAQLGVVLRRELGCDAGADDAAAEALADRVTRAGSKHRGAVALVTEQAPARALRALPVERDAAATRRPADATRCIGKSAPVGAVRPTTLACAIA